MQDIGPPPEITNEDWSKIWNQLYGYVNNAKVNTLCLEEYELAKEIMDYMDELKRKLNEPMREWMERCYKQDE